MARRRGRPARPSRLRWRAKERFHRRGRLIPRRIMGGRSNYFSTKLVGSYQLLNTDAVAISGGNSYLLNWPMFFRDSDGLIKSITTRSLHYNKCFAMFDEYKVTGLKIEMRIANTNYDYVTNPQIGNNATVSYPIYYTGIDYDSTELITNVPECITMTGGRRHQMYTGRPVTRYMKQQRYYKNKWFNTSQPNPGSMDNVPSTITDQLPTRGGIKIFSESFGTQRFAFDILATWYVKFRGLNMLQNANTVDIVSDIVPEGEYPRSSQMPDAGGLIFTNFNSEGNTGPGASTNDIIPIHP